MIIAVPQSEEKGLAVKPRSGWQSSALGVSDLHNCSTVEAYAKVTVEPALPPAGNEPMYFIVIN